MGVGVAVAVGPAVAVGAGTWVGEEFDVCGGAWLVPAVVATGVGAWLDCVDSPPAHPRTANQSRTSPANVTAGP